MIVLDANIFIYFANGTIDGSIISSKDIAYASITRIEMLGYAKITAEGTIALETWLANGYQISLSEKIINKAVRIRQQKNNGLGDAITAATALVHDLELWTANTEDFQHIEGLKLHNPLA